MNNSESSPASMFRPRQIIPVDELNRGDLVELCYKNHLFKNKFTKFIYDIEYDIERLKRLRLRHTFYHSAFQVDDFLSYEVVVVTVLEIEPLISSVTKNHTDYTPGRLQTVEFGNILYDSILWKGDGNQVPKVNLLISSKKI
jgi:hypothetical protein